MLLLRAGRIENIYNNEVLLKTRFQPNPTQDTRQDFYGAGPVCWANFREACAQ